MTILRSRKIIHMNKSQSPPKTLTQEGFTMEPMTPAKSLEHFNPTSNQATPSPTPTPTPTPLGLPTNRRRSSRLISNQSYEENVSFSGKRKSLVNQNCNRSNGFGLEDGESENEGFDLGVKKVRVLGQVGNDAEVSRKLKVEENGESEGICGNENLGFDLGVKKVGVLGRIGNDIEISRKLKVDEMGACLENGSENMGFDVGVKKVGVLGQDTEVLRELEVEESGESDGICGNENMGFDLDGKKERVSNEVRTDLELSRELGTEEEKGEVEEMDVCWDKSVGMDYDVLGSLKKGKEEFVGVKKGKGKSNFGSGVEFSQSKSVGRRGNERRCLNLRSGRKVMSSGVENSGSLEAVVVNELNREPMLNENVCGRRKRYSREEKGKGKSVYESMTMSVADCAKLKLEIKEEKPIGTHFSGSSDTKEENGLKDDKNGTSDMGRRFSREEKGKGKVVEDVLVSNKIDSMELEVKPKVKKITESRVSDTTRLENNVAVPDGRQVTENNSRANPTRGYKERFRNIAKKNASRFAHFSSHENEVNQVVNEAQREMPPREEKKEVEDWPGPFSTAMKIIKDRERTANVQQNSTSSETKPVVWVPRKDHKFDRSKLVVPPLQELCMNILAKHVDAITSLDRVPDVMRHKLSQLLCDSRKMNSHFFSLLASGSPTEIRVRDCSWMTEEQFTASFEGGDASNLTVLQLDQCGRCMPDYILLSILARASNKLPALTTISLKGACRLSDIGLRALVSSAPALRSINLSQCSLVTSDGIYSLAESLGPVLRELYLDDCQSVDPILILPALTKLENLEVLSVAGIPTVCDDFISQFVAVSGHHIKELVLIDCVKLTDYSLKVIAETCSGLCAIDLTNLCKLTDSAIGYLANGCQAIQTLKLCRNGFSDEAIAAYIETCGEQLKELSLNNVNKVAHNTALSLARRSRNLLSLDLSWCRNLTNEAVGLIVDSCSSLKLLKLFGCTQITNVFVDGHSNPNVKVIGLKMSPILEHFKVPDYLGPLHYSYVAAPM